MATPDDSSPASTVRLIIVDADRRVRDSLAALVGSSEHVEVVGGTGQLGGAIELIEAQEPDVVIIDPRLPEIDNGLGLITTIRQRWPGIGLLAMSWSDELASSCRECGVDGFIPKTDAPNEFIDAIVSAGIRHGQSAVEEGDGRTATTADDRRPPVAPSHDDRQEGLSGLIAGPRALPLEQH